MQQIVTTQLEVPDTMPDDLPDNIKRACKLAVKNGWAKSEFEWYQGLFLLINRYLKVEEEEKDAAGCNDSP